MRFMMDGDPHLNYNTLAGAGADVTSPPALRARARIPIMPSGPGRPACGHPDRRPGEAAAVVVNRQANSSPLDSSLSSARFAPEWRATLVSASCAMRNRCVSVSSGSRPEQLDSRVASMPVRAAKPSTSQRRPASSPKSSRMVGPQKLRHLPHVAEGLFHQVQAVFQACVVRLPPASSAVRLVLMAVSDWPSCRATRARIGGRWPPGPPACARRRAQFGRLPFHLAREPPHHANRDHREEKGQQHAGGREQERGGQ